MVQVPQVYSNLIAIWFPTDVLVECTKPFLHLICIQCITTLRLRHYFRNSFLLPRVDLLQERQQLHVRFKPTFRTFIARVVDRPNFIVFYLFET